MSNVITLQQLKSHLWESANILRGSIDSSDYKNYIFGLLFYKRLSDTFDEEYAKLVTQVGGVMLYLPEDAPQRTNADKALEKMGLKEDN